MEVKSDYFQLNGQIQRTATTTERFVPIAQRNTILNRFLKPKIKDLRYKTIKGDIKRMALIGQRPGGNIK